VHKLENIFIPLSAIGVSLVLFGLFVALAGVSPWDVYEAIYRGAFGSWFAWQNTLLGAAPLMLTTLCTALPARIGYVVIGGEGAVVVGGISAAVVALALGGVVTWLALPVILLASIAAGGIWIAAVGALRYYRGVNETISSLLLNYIAIAVMNFLIFGLLKDPQTLNKPSTFPVDENFLIGTMGDTMVHWGLLYGLVICVVLWLVMRHSTFGFAVDIAGGNAKAAQLAGLPVAKLLIITFFIGGAAAGLAGALEVLAVHGRANSSLNAGYGYEGILIAFLARHNPLAIIPLALLLGGIRAGNGVLQRSLELPDASGLVLQGILFIVILASEAFYGRFRFFQVRGAAA
jgi:simple sugar transport system permease protein